MTRQLLTAVALSCCASCSLTINNGDESGAGESVAHESGSGDESTTGDEPSTSSGASESFSSTSEPTDDSSSGGSTTEQGDDTGANSCDDLPGSYEACSQECGPGFVCLDAEVCVYSSPGLEYAHCTTNCVVDEDCPPSIFDDYPSACESSHCWIPCIEEKCPDGYVCFVAPFGIPPVCMPPELNTLR